MNESFDEIDLAACSRRARRWAIGLLCLLAVNGSLVALALGGFGAAQPRSVTAARPVTAAMPPPKKAAPLGTVPLPAKSAGQPSIKPPPTAPPAADNSNADPPPAPNGAESPAADPMQPIDPLTTPQPPAAPPPVNGVPFATDSLIVVNPPTTGGAVHFAVDGVVHRLDAGEFAEFAELVGRRERQIEFHRGDDFGYARHQFASGALAFGVGEAGWTLTPLDPAAVRELLSTCRDKSR
jgi:hypothetical protein